MKYLVALNEGDESKIVDVALKHAVAGRDCLLFARVVEEVRPEPVILLDILCDDDGQMKLEEETRRKLEPYGKACVAAGVDCAFMVLSDDHPGAAICKAARDHKADCIVVGRRDLWPIQRFISFSTSKYCIDNADCNVIVVKRNYPEEATSNQPPKPKQTTIAENEARQLATEIPPASTSQVPSSGSKFGHRILTLRDPVEMQRAFNRANAPQKIGDTQEQEEKDSRRANLEIVRALEEQERAERIREWNEAELKEEEAQKQRGASDIKEVIRLEELERERRVLQENEELEKETRRQNLQRSISLEKLYLAEEKERSDRVRALHEEERKEQEVASVSSKQDRELVKQLEDQEQERRIQKDAKQLSKQSMESTKDLLQVKQMEEEERARRMNAMQVQE